MRVCIFLSCLLALSACTTQTLRNEELWYSVVLPKGWTAEQPNVYTDGSTDVLRIVRLRDDSDLDRLVESTKRAFQMEMANFVMESEDLIKLRGHPSWRMVGTYKKNKTNEEITMLKVIINAGQYKYVLDFQTPSEGYNQRKALFERMIASFFFEIPKY